MKKIIHKKRNFKISFKKPEEIFMSQEGFVGDPFVKGLIGSEPATRGELGTAPAHYTHGKIEPWDVVKDWGLEYFTGCAMKYVCRHKHKGTPEQDIQKAIDYLVEYKKTLSQETK